MRRVPSAAFSRISKDTEAKVAEEDEHLPMKLFKAAVLCSIMIACWMNANGVYGSVNGVRPLLLVYVAC